MRSPFPHQITSSDFLASEGHYLAASPGTGKTLSSILALQKMGARSVLTTCPSILTSMWPAAVAEDWEGAVGVDGRRFPKKVKDANLVALSMDWMRYDGAIDLVKQRRWDALICDEAHMLGSPEAARTQAVLLDPAFEADKVIFLSGTPTPSHAGQLWPMIRRTAWDRIDRMPYDAFVDRYCRVQMRKFPGMRTFQRHIAGTNPATLVELRQRLDGWWLRIRKEDVLKDLPPKLYARVNLPISRLDWSKIEAEVDPEVLEAVQFAAEIGDVGMLSRLGEGVSTLRRLLAMAKVDGCVSYVLGLRDFMPDQPVAVWGLHVAALTEIAERLRSEGKMKVGLITGQTPHVERERIVREVQDGTLDAFVGQIHAAGTGITLTRISRSVMLERAFRPGDNEQAIDRHHRIGQAGVVQVDDLVLEGSIDMAVLAICARRADESDALLRDSGLD